ncbi:MAG: hypothetical protein Q9207_005496 [Kuettlingeria erythrocarpa]
MEQVEKDETHKAVPSARKSKENLHKASPKNGIPPKRAVTAADRTKTPTAPIASRPTVSSMTRNVPKESLSKASSRPLSTADEGRPRSNVTASTTPTLGRKWRNSASSVDTPTKTIIDTANGKTGDAEHRPLSSSERAESTSPVKFLLRSPSKRSTLASSPAIGKSSHSTAGAPLRTASTRGADAGRAQSGTGSSRSGRIGTSPTPIKTMTSGSNGRAPSNRVTGATKATSIRAPSPLKKVRPGLGTRKSTLSVTIEQRLREMSLVHQMLHAAMAEEGDEDDEVKEAYGKQMDEQLAALKARLEEAKVEEGLVDSGPETNDQPAAAGSSDPTLPADEIVATTADDRQIDVTAHQTETSPEESRLKEQETVLTKNDWDCMNRELSDRRTELEGLKGVFLKMDDELNSVRAQKDQELSHMQQVVESLQDSICRLHETRERELHDVKTSLAQEHKDIVLGLQDSIRELQETRDRDLQDVRMSLEREHKEVVSGFQDTIRRLHEMQGDLEQSSESTVEEIRSTYQIQQEQLQAALTSAQADNVKLRSSLEESLSSEIDRSNQLRATLAFVHDSAIKLRIERDGDQSSFEQKVQEALAERDGLMAEVSELRAEMETVRQQFSDLGQERNAAQASNADILRQLSENVSNLQQQLTDSHNEELAILEKKVEAEQKLAATQKMLDDLREKHQRLSADHEIELSTMRSLRQELERSRIEAQDAHDALELDYVTTQSQLDSVQAELADARSKGQNAINEGIAKVQLELGKTTEACAKLGSELEKAQAEAQKYKTKACELGSALKVTTAELVELRTERPSGGSYSGSPVPNGLRSSRWAREDRDGECDSDDIKAIDRMIDRMERIVPSPPKSSPEITYRHVRPSSNGHVQYRGDSTTDGDDEAQDS